jgi:hypothetical protein
VPALRLRHCHAVLAQRRTQAINALHEAQKGAAIDSWQPTVENINALPKRVPHYIHRLETLSHPARFVREHALLKEQVRVAKEA